MKMLLSLLFSLAMATPALAQGKIRLVNDSLHLVYWDPSGAWNPPGYSGQVYTNGAAGLGLAIELWAGTSSTALTLVGSTSFAGQVTPGTWTGMNILLPNGFPAGALTYFRVEIYDQAAGSFEHARFSYYVYGASPIFTALPGVAAYNSIASHIPSPGATSTWADGTYNLDGDVFPGARGAIMLTSGPEPSTFAFGCLGFALLLLRRREGMKRVRKHT
jgi:hypothetical protein